MIIINIKKLLKLYKLHENSIRRILVFVILVLTGLTMRNYLMGKGSTVPANKTENVQNSNTFHTVVGGESLWKISENYYGTGYKWVDIAKANRLMEPGLIFEGQNLEIPEVSKTSEGYEAVNSKNSITMKTDKPEEKINQSESKDTVYIVVKGDNLWKIAQKYYGDGNRWQEIAKKNNLVNPRIIHSGNVLIVP